MKRNLFFLCGLLLSTCVVWAQQTDSIQGVEVPAVVDSVNNATTTTVEQPKVASQPTQRAAVLSGPFTISPSAVVKFSPGNLQYNPKQKIWRFAPNQHDMIGKVNSHISDEYDGWIDLFGWGTAKTPTLYEKDADYASKIEVGDFPIALDWGRHEIDGYQPLVWRTMSKDEWAYLFYQRKNAKDLVTIGSIDGINGLIILPDNWNHKWDKENFTYPLLFNLTSYSGYNHFPLEIWQTQFEKRGAIFLPCAGFREVKHVKQVNTGGSYWSSTGFRNNSAYSFTFTASTLDTNLDFFRYKARAVRLVHAIRGR